MKNKRFELPSAVQIILYTLNKAGYEAYIVGGCVRDMIMGRIPQDWDITTSAIPEQVKEIFPRTYDTGLKHGTVTVRIDKENYEITTYRIEGIYKDYRRPSEVEFVNDISLDLGRRDFTINAIAYHPKQGFIDPYLGLQDIESETLKAVRIPKERFTEDALRILRCVRFSAQLGFKIEEETLTGMLECSHLLQHISKERIRDEFVKILLSRCPEKLIDMYNWGLLEYIIPEFIPCFCTPQNHPHHMYNVAMHTIHSIKGVPNDLVLRLTMLLHDIGKPPTHTRDKKGVDHFYGHVSVGVEMSKDILKRLRFDNNTIRQVASLVEYHDFHIQKKITKEGIKKVLKQIGTELFEKLLLVQEADARAQNPNKLEPKLKNLEEIKKVYKEVVAKGECYSIRDLAIDGKDIVALGNKEGKEIGILLDKSLEYVINHPEENKKDNLISLIKKGKIQ